MFSCIESWPARPAGLQKIAPLSISPGTLWTKDLPSKGPPLSWPMAATGSGVAFSFVDTLLIYDGDGNLVRSVQKPQSQGSKISSPVAGPDGSLYFADRSYAYHVDRTGQPIWQKPLGADQTGGRAAAPQWPLLDPAGRLYVSALDGMLWVFRGEDGEVLSSLSIGTWQNQARLPFVGIGDVIALDRSGIAAAGPGVAATGFLSTKTGTWLGEVTVADRVNPPSVYAGYDIGVVATANLAAGGTETDVFDKCGSFRWRVPGNYSVPLVITFDDDLIILDREPTGGGTNKFALRRFSRDGALLAGPVPVADEFCGRAFVGADDTFYYTGGASDGYRLRAFDSSLHEIWVIPFPHCPDAAVLSAGGKIFTARGGDGKLVAVQTTSPGAAPVSWPEAYQGRDARATLWLAP
jgi:hypothetical protein